MNTAQREIATVPVHCYTNPSFCIQSELVSGGVPPRGPPEPSPPLPPPPPPDDGEENLPPPPPSFAYNGESNGGFQTENPEFSRASVDRYCYLPEGNPRPTHRRYASLPVQEESYGGNNQSSRYQYIEEERKSYQLQRRASARYDVVGGHPGAARVQLHQQQTCRARYAIIPGEQEYDDEGRSWVNEGEASPGRRQIRTPQGCYSSLQQDEPPPPLPEWNIQESHTTKNNLATQKLHEILTTPRKPRSKSAERTISSRRQYNNAPQTGTPQRRAFTPNGSPTSQSLISNRRESLHGSPQSHGFSQNGLKSSTPHRESSARRCLPLSGTNSRTENFEKLRYPDHHLADVSMLHAGELSYVHSPRYARLENGMETMSLVTTSPRYQITQSQPRNDYVDNAFLAKTAVVPPLSPPNSETNITLMSGIEKSDRKYAPFLLILVGILTCGLAIYLSWSTERSYYYDSAIGCGACCTLAGASRNLRRTWTGLSLAGLSAISCLGLFLLASESPKPGTPLHDITAGALCGVSLLGASLALLSLLAPKCRLPRHRRVHNWMPQFSHDN